MTIDIGVGLILGVTIGLFFFGGLRLTLEWLAKAKRPELLAVLSFVIRMASVAGVMVWLATQSLGSVVAGLVGLLGARTILITRAGSAGEGHRWT